MGNKILITTLSFLLFSCYSENSKTDLSIFSEPAQSTSCNGIPVFTYGYTDILAESPDLVDSVKIQFDNNNPFFKVHPKKSSEIKFNRLGSNTPRI